MEMYVLHSYEVDNAAYAVQDILQALPAHALKAKNVVGILTVHTDAVSSGVVQAISEALPFDVLGMTVFASTGGGDVDYSIISLVLFISEECTFTIGISDDLSKGYEQEIDAMYARMEPCFAEKPALGLVYASFLRHVSGQDMVSYLDKITGSIPLFGGFASDFTYFADDASVFYNGKIYTRALVLLCISGPIKPSFLYAALGADELQRKEAIITASEGNTVFTVNDIPVAEYLYSLGFSMEELALSGSAVPFVIDFHDGTPIMARELVGVTPEKHIYFGGTMPVGATIAISKQVAASVLQHTQDALQCIENKKDNTQCVLAMNCTERSVMLSSEPLREAEEALKLWGQSQSYHHCYVRGEICPATFADGKLENRFHNFTFIACVLEKVTSEG